MGRLGVSVVSGGMGGSSASLTDQASLFALLTEHGIYHGGLQVGWCSAGCSVLKNRDRETQCRFYQAPVSIMALNSCLHGRILFFCPVLFLAF